MPLAVSRAPYRRNVLTELGFMPLASLAAMPPLNLGIVSGGVPRWFKMRIAMAAMQRQPANDNAGITASARIDEAVLRFARLIGRQMAREQFQRASPANDNESHHARMTVASSARAPCTEVLRAVAT